MNSRQFTESPRDVFIGNVKANNTCIRAVVIDPRQRDEKTVDVMECDIRASKQFDDKHQSGFKQCMNEVAQTGYDYLGNSPQSRNTHQRWLKKFYSDKKMTSCDETGKCGCSTAKTFTPGCTGLSTATKSKPTISFPFSTPAVTMRINRTGLGSNIASVENVVTDVNFEVDSINLRYINELESCRPLWLASSYKSQVESLNNKACCRVRKFHNWKQRNGQQIMTNSCDEFRNQIDVQSYQELRRIQCHNTVYALPEVSADRQEQLGVNANLHTDNNVENNTSDDFCAVHTLSHHIGHTGNYSMNDSVGTSSSLSEVSEKTRSEDSSSFETICSQIKHHTTEAINNCHFSHHAKHQLDNLQKHQEIHEYLKNLVRPRDNDLKLQRIQFAPEKINMKFNDGTILDCVDVFMDSRSKDEDLFCGGYHSTVEARRLIGGIKNVIGAYVCRLCENHYEDAFLLAAHNCRRISRMEHRCALCRKVFNSSANLASHRRWHRPPQQGTIS